MHNKDKCKCGGLKNEESKKCKYCFSGAEPFECETCGKTFYRATKIRKGRRNMNGVKRKGAKTCSKKCSKDRRS